MLWEKLRTRRERIIDEYIEGYSMWEKMVLAAFLKRYLSPIRRHEAKANKIYKRWKHIMDKVFHDLERLDNEH